MSNMQQQTDASHVLRVKDGDNFRKVCDLKSGRGDSLFGSISNGDAFYVDANPKAEEGKPSKFLKVRPKGAKDSQILTGLFKNKEKGYLSGKDRETGMTYYVLENKPQQQKRRA